MYSLKRYYYSLIGSFCKKFYYNVGGTIYITKIIVIKFITFVLEVRDEFVVI